MKVFHRILLYVDSHYSQDCTLKVAAKHLQYDYAYLSKLFVHITNMTFTEYLTHYQISQVCYQLKNRKLPIGKIAITVGYNNLRSFHRHFKKITRISPRK
ncbi:AraC family transcriptional regulator [Niallia circulans]|uniref:helix-turn-helix domain-containing protein n=1 Tax=Niallia circulans TaxID=1397 RepID=UPI001C27C446|nr:helix-turn-helix transcriptional regulator [Niallia circulans]